MVANRRGQAIFEFIVFLPILLIFYGIIVSISSAINGSINQQKSTRGHTHGLIKGNPTIPLRVLLKTNEDQNEVRLQGMFAHLYGDRFTGGDPSQPYATCYDIPTYGEVVPEECDDPVDASDNSSPRIRVKTAYGLCGATYYVNPDKNSRIEVHYVVSGSERGCQALSEP